MWNMTIACALRWGVAFVGSFSTRHGSPFKGKYFRCGTDSGGQCSFEATIVKKVDMCLLITFL